LWRFHPALVRFNQDANRVLSTMVNRAGGQLVADQWVRRFGSHHQKLLVIHFPNRPGRCIEFVGGIDLSRGRRDNSGHLGDADPVRIDPRYGRRPPWHDLQLELHGPAVLDVDFTLLGVQLQSPVGALAERLAQLVAGDEPKLGGGRVAQP
jgi:phosphatidylserine/phosphatidylglycerophosphate/cardiolipin synthase-like enzyme